MIEMEKERTGPWIQVYSGRAIYPFEPRVSDIDIMDIAHACAGEPRFGSHTLVYGYSVAEHQVRGSYEVPEEDAADFLFHDASEAYLRDLPRPVKKSPELAFYRRLEARWTDVIGAHFGLRFRTMWSEEMPQSVEDVDLRMLATEKRDLMRAEPKPWMPLPPPYAWKIEPWGPDKAKARFLERYAELQGKGLCA